MVLIGPALALVILFVLIPIVIAVYLSFTNWDGFTFPPKWIGPANYLRMLQDPTVARAAGVTAVIAVVGAVACNVLGLGVAFSSTATPASTHCCACSSSIRTWSGPSSSGSSGLRSSAPMALSTRCSSRPAPRVCAFLSNPAFALASSIGVIVWTSFGINVVLYLAGLQTIPDSLIEAARIDGASTWQTFWRVKLPMLAPTVTLNVVLALIGLLRVYELVLALTAGGPAGTHADHRLQHPDDLVQRVRSSATAPRSRWC